MNKQTTSSLFMLSSMPRLYQRLLNGISDYHQLGNRIISEIKAAHAFRRVDEVRELSSVLLNLPLKEYRLIGQYYLAWCECRKLNYSTENLDVVIEHSRTYKAKALISKAAFEFYQGDYDNALSSYLESLKARPDVSEYLLAVKGMAVIKSIEGFHPSALRDLESLIPLARYAEPFAFNDVLNSYAVELGEVGRREEARNVSNIVLASPFAPAYSEWQQTAIDVQPPNRSFAFVNPLIGENVLRFRPSKQPSQWSRKLAKLLIFGRPFGAAMKKKKQDDKKQQIIDQYSKMTKTEKAKMIRQRVMNDDLPDDVIEAMLHILTEYELNR